MFQVLLSVKCLKILQAVAGNDINRPKLSGIQFTDGWAYATDGHRAYCCKVNMPETVSGWLPRAEFKDVLKGRGIDRTFAVEETDLRDYPQIKRLLLTGAPTIVTSSWVKAFMGCFHPGFDMAHVAVTPNSITRSLNLDGEWTVGRKFDSAYVGEDFSLILNCAYALSADFVWNEFQKTKTVFQVSNSVTGEKMILMQIAVREPNLTRLQVALRVAHY